ncbi:hypothetical protein AOLI_G00139200 [Acnodon oligacanthus]
MHSREVTAASGDLRNFTPGSGLTAMMDEEDANNEGYEEGLEPGEEPRHQLHGEVAMCESIHRRYPGHRSYIMYHGTTMENAINIRKCGFFQSPDGMLGRGVYVSRNFEKARRFPQFSGGKQLAVLRVNVRVGKVKKIDYQGHPMQKTWHCYGYNTAWVPPNCGMTPTGQEEDCVYNPRRITVLDIMPNHR